MAKKNEAVLIKNGKLTKHGKDVQKELERRFPKLSTVLKKPKVVDMKVTPGKKVHRNDKITKKQIDHMKLWDGMPEFEQESAQPIKKIIVGFATQEDMLKFSKLVGQPITPKTRSIWYPPLVHKPIYNKRWSDKKIEKGAKTGIFESAKVNRKKK